MHYKYVLFPFTSDNHHRGGLNPLFYVLMVFRVYNWSLLCRKIKQNLERSLQDCNANFSIVNTMCESDMRKIEFAMQIENESILNIKRWSRSRNNVQGNWKKVERRDLFIKSWWHTFQLKRLQHLLTAPLRFISSLLLPLIIILLCFISSHHHHFTVQQHLKQNVSKKSFWLQSGLLSCICSTP